jgi:hypothetical protein
MARWKSFATSELDSTCPNYGDAPGLVYGQFIIRNNCNIYHTQYTVFLLFQFKPHSLRTVQTGGHPA